MEGRNARRGGRRERNGAPRAATTSTARRPRYIVGDRIASRRVASRRVTSPPLPPPPRHRSSARFLLLAPRRRRVASSRVVPEGDSRRYRHRRRSRSIRSDPLVSATRFSLRLLSLVSRFRYIRRISTYLAAYIRRRGRRWCMQPVVFSRRALSLLSHTPDRLWPDTQPC